MEVHTALHTVSGFHSCWWACLGARMIGLFRSPAAVCSSRAHWCEQVHIASALSGQHQVHAPVYFNLRSFFLCFFFRRFLSLFVAFRCTIPNSMSVLWKILIGFFASIGQPSQDHVRVIAIRMKVNFDNRRQQAAKKKSPQINRNARSN